MKSVLEVPTVQPLHKHARMVVGDSARRRLELARKTWSDAFRAAHKSAVTDNVARVLADPAAGDTTGRTSC